MIVAAKNIDVFLSYSYSEEYLAEGVERSLCDQGLRVHGSQNAAPGEDYTTHLRALMAKSDVLIVIATPTSLNSSLVMIEVGAALAWNIPIHVLLSGMSQAALPLYLQRFRSTPIAEIGRLVDEIEATIAREDFGDDELDVLQKLYVKMGQTVDQLAIHRSDLESFTSRFNRLTGSQHSSTSLLKELLTLRKRGQLPKSKPA